MSERPLRPIMIVPDFDRIGGYERQAFFLTRHCIERGIASLIVTNRPPGLPARELRDGVVIHRLDSLPPTRPNWANVFKSFLRFLDSHRDEYDVIHCHAMTFLSACCVVIGKLLSKPVLIKVATEQDVREFHTNKKLGFRVFYPLVRRADRFLSLTESIRAEFRACGFDDRRVVLVHNGVESRLFDRARPEQRKRERRALGVEDGRFQFLFSGRLVHRKGVDVLLDAMSLARRTDFEVLILGDGEERRRLEARARRLEQVASRYANLAVKDVRFCLTLSAWRQVVPVDKVVVCLRHPTEVARSLHKRQRYPIWLGYRFWDYHIRSLLEQLDGLPALYVRFEALTGGGYREELERLAAFLPLDVPEDERERVFRGLFDPNLRHHQADPEDRLPETTRALWAELLARHGAQGDPPAGAGA